MVCDELHAPRQRVAAAARDAGIDERIEELTFLDAKTCHDRDGKRGEELAVLSDPRAPRHEPAEALLRLVRDGDALLARALAELLDPP